MPQKRALPSQTTCCVLPALSFDNRSTEVRAVRWLVFLSVRTGWQRVGQLLSWLVSVCGKMDLTCIENLDDIRVAQRDRSIFDDDRVLQNLLSSEFKYMPKFNYFNRVQTEVQPYMRKIVTTWMMEVSTLYSYHFVSYDIYVIYL